MRSLFLSSECIKDTECPDPQNKNNVQTELVKPIYGIKKARIKKAWVEDRIFTLAEDTTLTWVADKPFPEIEPATCVVPKGRYTTVLLYTLVIRLMNENEPDHDMSDMIWYFDGEPYSNYWRIHRNGTARNAHHNTTYIYFDQCSADLTRALGYTREAKYINIPDPYQFLEITSEIPTTDGNDGDILYPIVYIAIPEMFSRDQININVHTNENIMCMTKTVSVIDDDNNDWEGTNVMEDKWIFFDQPLNLTHLTIRLLGVLSGDLINLNIYGGRWYVELEYMTVESILNETSEMLY